MRIAQAMHASDLETQASEQKCTMAIQSKACMTQNTENRA